MTDVDLRYPIGRLVAPAETGAGARAEWIERIEFLPAEFRAAVAGLTPQQLDTPYRPGGWTVRQLVHHVPDSHLNAYVRFKLALSERDPTIRPYDQDAWALLPDTVYSPIETSLDLLASLHVRWATLLRALSEQEFERTYFHPESGRRFTLAEALGMYAWHGDHHLAHVTGLCERMGWRVHA
jgi:hypothetical protein